MTRDDRLTRTLLACGAAAGPFYLLTGLAQVLTRPGFDVRRHALSQLSNGDLAWIQITNFAVSSGLVIAGAFGARRRLTGARGGTWGPLLLGVYGLGLLGAAAFSADPGRGFPPGTPETVTLSRNGLLHFVAGGVGFYALIGACLVFARRFAALGRRGWARYSAATAVAFFLSFAAIASGSMATTTMLAFYVAVAWIWVWHTALMLSLRRGPT